ncbi:PTS sugar transporter subunit IIA [Brachybacterium paraconglomeratum]|uniref:PTS sugar transporter subunit IIA n=1 Tax=Brachybacterium paraconglomeratum TaxID=173362 RepID=UPI0031E74D9C
MSTEPSPPAAEGPAAPLALTVVLAHLDVSDSEDALRSLAGRLLDAGAVTPGFPKALRLREQTYPTGLPTPIPTAIPHADPQHVLVPGLAVATLARPVTFGEMGTRDSTVDVRLVAMPLLTDAREHLAALQQLMGLLSDESAVQDLLDAPDEETLRRRFEEHLASILPPADGPAVGPAVDPTDRPTDAPSSGPQAGAQGAGA